MEAAKPNNLNLPFVLSVIGAFIASFVVAKLYVWPTLRSLPRYNALRILASLHAFRFLGMNFVVIGFVSPALSSAVGDQIAWGDFVAASATDAAGTMDISKGNSNFIVFLDSIWFGQVVTFWARCNSDCERAVTSPPTIIRRDTRLQACGR